MQGRGRLRALAGQGGQQAAARRREPPLAAAAERHRLPCASCCTLGRPSSALLCCPPSQRSRCSSPGSESQRLCARPGPRHAGAGSRSTVRELTLMQSEQGASCLHAATWAADAHAVTHAAAGRRSHMQRRLACHPCFTVGGSLFTRLGSTVVQQVQFPAHAHTLVAESGLGAGLRLLARSVARRRCVLDGHAGVLQRAPRARQRARRGL